MNEYFIFSAFSDRKTLFRLFRRLCYIAEAYNSIMKLISRYRFVVFVTHLKITVTWDQNVRFPWSKFAPMNVTALSKVTEIQMFFYFFRVQYIHQL